MRIRNDCVERDAAKTTSSHGLAPRLLATEKLDGDTAAPVLLGKGNGIPEEPLQFLSH